DHRLLPGRGSFQQCRKPRRTQVLRGDHIIEHFLRGVWVCSYCPRCNFVPPCQRELCLLPENFVVSRKINEDLDHFVCRHRERSLRSSLHHIRWQGRNADEIDHARHEGIPRGNYITGLRSGRPFASFLRGGKVTLETVERRCISFTNGDTLIEVIGNFWRSWRILAVIGELKTLFSNVRQEKLAKIAKKKPC